MKKILSENFKSKMLRLSGVDLNEEEKKANIELIKESNFLHEQILEEGGRTLALALLSLLSVLTASSQDAKTSLLKVNLKNHSQVEDYKKRLTDSLSDDKLKTTDYKAFINKLSELEKQVGTHSKHEGVVTHYTDAVVNETNLTFDLSNPESKKKLDALLSKSKSEANKFIVSIDTLKQMINVAPPTEEVKMNSKVKIANQNFKGYNDFKADESIVDSIAQQIIKTFEGYNNVYGYILVNGNASHVPTKSFGGDNEKLAQARACSLSQQLGEKLPGNLANTIMVDFKVDGPQYENDANNTAKYAPFQFSNVTINLTAVKSVPLSVTPTGVIVKVKLLSASIGGEQSVAGTVVKTGKGAGKGRAKVACPVKY